MKESNASKSVKKLRIMPLTLQVKKEKRIRGAIERSLNERIDEHILLILFISYKMFNSMTN